MDVSVADPWAHSGGNFFLPRQEPPRAPDLPMRPPGQAGPTPPAQNYYVDRVENGRATLLDPRGVPRNETASPGMHESRMADGSMPQDDGGALRARLGAGDRGGDISLEEIGASLPKVPLAPGSPGPALPPPADSFIGQKKGGQKKRRVTP
jgi:hypothetical protein